MFVDKECLICGNKFKVPHWRDGTAKYCSAKCQRESLKAKPNLICSICGKEFHRKPSHIKRFNGDYGFCCSKRCDKELRRIRMTGEGNHQFGIRGSLNSSFVEGSLLIKNNSVVDEFIYVGDWYKGYNDSGRIPIHRYMVELNYALFDICNFNEIDGWHYLKKGLVVHHKDFNHNNNSLDNLQVLSKREHIRVHNIANPRKRNNKGHFIPDCNED